MKLTINKVDLVNALSVVQKAISQRSPMPILSCVHFEAAEDRLVFTATDTEITVLRGVPASVEAAGEVVVPAKQVADLAKLLPDVPIELEADGSTLLLRYGKSEVKINGFPVEEYPSKPEREPGVTVAVPGPLLKQMWASVAHAVSKDLTRPIFTGVLLEVAGNKLRMVATDTYRLAAVERAIESEGKDSQVIIPGNVLDKYVPHLAGHEEVKVEIGKNRVTFTVPGMIVSCRTISGQYPPYRQVIPKEYSTSFVVNGREFIAALDRARVIANAIEGKLVLLDIKTDGVSVSSGSESGSIVEMVQVKGFDGKNMQIYFNASYLHDSVEAVLETTEQEDIKINMTGPLSAAVLSFTESEDIFLLLPAKPPKGAASAA
jgi:DNA polymerase-3 subunit beta